MPTLHELYGLDDDEPLAPVAREEQGDFVRGAKVSMGQLGPILKGVAGLAGATAEQTFGEGGIATAVKDWGLKGYEEGMAKLAPLQKDTDELTTSWARCWIGRNTAWATPLARSPSRRQWASRAA